VYEACSLFLPQFVGHESSEKMDHPGDPMLKETPSFCPKHDLAIFIRKMAFGLNGERRILVNNQFKFASSCELFNGCLIQIGATRQ